MNGPPFILLTALTGLDKATVRMGSTSMHGYVAVLSIMKEHKVQT